MPASIHVQEDICFENCNEAKGTKKTMHNEFNTILKVQHVEICECYLDMKNFEMSPPSFFTTRLLLATESLFALLS